MTKVQPIEPAEGRTTFDIFVLGTRSSGKSVLLASLYRQLSSMDGVTNFFARCDDPEQHRELCDNYDLLLDTESGWPAGTYSVDSYEMSCFHRLRGKTFPVFSIRFHDYPGGYVTNQTEKRDFIEEKVKQCTTIVALIDGRKLLDRLTDAEVNPAQSLHRDLDSLVRVLQQCVGKPIHFILTKADLFDSAKYPFKDIVAALKEHKGFSDILAQQLAEESPCYLVPVSAIGPRFARIDPADGVIKKLRNGTIEPLNLDVMMSASMVDGVIGVARQAAEAQAEPPPEPKAGALPWLRRRLGRKLTYARMLAPVAAPVFGHLGVLGIIALSAASEHYIGDKTRGFEEKVRIIRNQIQDRASALEAILTIQFQILDRFVSRIPASRLGARQDPTSQLADISDLARAGLPTEPPVEDNRGSQSDRKVGLLAGMGRPQRFAAMCALLSATLAGGWLFESEQHSNPAGLSSAELQQLEAAPPANPAKADKSKGDSTGRAADARTASGKPERDVSDASGSAAQNATGASPTNPVKLAAFPKEFRGEWARSKDECSEETLIIGYNQFSSSKDNRLLKFKIYSKGDRTIIVRGSLDTDKDNKEHDVYINISTNGDFMTITPDDLHSGEKPIHAVKCK